MRTPRPLPEGAVERLAARLKEAKNQAEYQRIQCLWLRAALSVPASQMATALGWQVSSVWQVHSDSLRQGEAALWSVSFRQDGLPAVRKKCGVPESVI